MSRNSLVERQTKETQISLEVNIDGKGIYSITTGIPFLDHMLELFAKHGLFDLKITASGDTDVDDHHTVEDIGMCLGEAVNNALGDKTGIRRYGFFLLPMDEALAEVAIDLSGRPFVVFNAEWHQEKIKTFDTSLVEEFWRGFGTRAFANLHINVKSGKDAHHVCEAIFKAVARALDAATSIDARRSDIPSTKGTLTE
ncbi:MAG: imidazoleglycerol-phosphate dehydratase HisB [Chlamydiae bacterium]|nr:MAG: imidazoleglycerol-phosphate dehydratase HisB [Chlamydiota bacterium]